MLQDYWINVVNNFRTSETETVGNKFSSERFLITSFSLVHVVTGWCFTFINHQEMYVKIINAKLNLFLHYKNIC